MQSQLLLDFKVLFHWRSRQRQPGSGSPCWLPHQRAAQARKAKRPCRALHLKRAERPAQSHSALFAPVPLLRLPAWHRCNCNCCNRNPWLGLQYKILSTTKAWLSLSNRTQSKRACSRPGFSAVVDLTMYFGCIRLSRYPPKDKVSERDFSGEDFISSLTLYRISDKKICSCLPPLKKCSYSSLRDSCGQIPTELYLSMNQSVFSFQ